MKAAPEFTLPDQHGQEHSLTDYRGRWMVLYFYPKDDTPGCTKEACSFRDGRRQLEELGVTVLGVSADSVESHRRFASKYHLDFTLLSDPDKTTIKAYGSDGKLGVKRNTYVIDPNGVIVKEYIGVKPENHADEIIAEVTNRAS